MSSIPSAHSMVRPGDPFAMPTSLGPPGGAPPIDAGVGAGDIWRIITQRKLLVAVTAIILYLLVVAATLLVWKYAPAYPAEAYLQMDPPKENPMDPGEAPYPIDAMRTQLETEARKIKQFNVLRNVIELPEVRQTNFYKWYKDDIAELLFELQRMLTVAHLPETNLLKIELATQYPKESVLLVKSIVDQYMREFGETTKETMFNRLADLRNTKAAVEKSLSDKRTEIARFRDQADVPALENERGITAVQISTLTEKLADLETDAAYIQSTLDSIRGVDLRNLPVTAEMAAIIESDPIVQWYDRNVEQMEIEIDVMTRGRLGTSHRDIEAMHDRRLRYQQKSAARREQLADEMRARFIESMQQRLAGLRSAQQHLQEQIEEYQSKQRDLDRNIRKFQEMRDDEQRIQLSLLELDKKVQEAQHATSAGGRGRLTLVQSPVEANMPSRPNFWLFLGGGAVLALLGGVGLAFVREFTDKAVRTPLDVVRFGHLSVLGSIPLLDDEEADLDSIELATRRAPHSLVAEAYRQVRTNLLFSGPAETQHALLITSPSPDDGKTSVSINLAVTLAQSNQRVLLVDCNFRKPAIRTAFEGCRSEGLSNLLVGQARFDDVVNKTDLATLDVVTSGPMPPSPAELLGSQYMRDFVQEAKQRYDRVILDGPPVLLISDSLVLATVVDGVILVARAVNNTKGALKRAREQLERVRARIVGAVLNGAQARAGGYFKRQYRDFYEYTSDETIPRDLVGGNLLDRPRNDDANG